jgi:hypothetical protein
LKQAAKRAAKAAHDGLVSGGCAASIASSFEDAKDAAESWLRTR